ncbi:MAG TPA: metallophosphoesterase [Syntrophobacteraceae bacterium]|nr:metallophosphoesterase [Syntrophobacteraceae bacterium]
MGERSPVPGADSFSREADYAKRCVFLLLALILWFPCPAAAEKWSFVALGDNRHGFAAYLDLLEGVAQLHSPENPRQPPLDFALICGDFTPVSESYESFRRLLGPPPPFLLPVRGNHENREDVEVILGSILPSLGPRVRSPHEKSVTYFADWKNVRLVVLDPLSDFGSVFGGDRVIKWLPAVLEPPSSIQHVFLAMHKPLFLNPRSHWKLWQVLLQHRERVRGVFTAHTHAYDHKRFPHEDYGIDVINVGNTGSVSHGDRRQTIVRVLVEGPDVAFEIYQSTAVRKKFQWWEGWSSRATTTKEAARSGKEPRP